MEAETKGEQEEELVLDAKFVLSPTPTKEVLRNAVNFLCGLEKFNFHRKYCSQRVGNATKMTLDVCCPFSN